MTRNKVLIALVVVVVLALVVWGSMRTSGGKGPAVELEKVGTRTVVATVKGTGEINPKTKVEVQAKVIGEIVALPVREGDAVEGRPGGGGDREAAVPGGARPGQGAPRPGHHQPRTGQGRARQRRARPSRAPGSCWQMAWSPRRRWSGHNWLPRAPRSPSGRRTRRSARHAPRYERALDDLARTTIRSPMDGLVTALNVEKGETAMMGTMNFSGSVLMMIGDLSELLAEVEVAESEVVQVALGQEATVKVDALPDTPPGRQGRGDRLLGAQDGRRREVPGEGGAGQRPTPASSPA